MGAMVSAPTISNGASNLEKVDSANLNVGVTGPLTQTSCRQYCFPYSREDIREIADTFYNAQSCDLIYVLQTCINAINHAHIEARNWANHTIVNVIGNEGYCDHITHIDENRYILVPYGSLINGEPLNCYKVGTLGDKTLTTRIDSSVISASVSCQYDISICSIAGVHDFPSAFSSFQNLCNKGETVDKFVSMVETKYMPGVHQEVSLTTIGAVTYPGWLDVLSVQREQQTVTYETTCLP